MKNKELLEMFERVIEVSHKRTIKSFDANPSDSTYGENLTVYAYMQHGFTVPSGSPEPYKQACGRNAFGNYHPEGNSHCQRCVMFLPDLAEACMFESLGYSEPDAPQLLKIEIQRIWGWEITVTDEMTNEVIMNCYYDDGWAPRKTRCKPQATIRSILWNADFLNHKEKEKMKSSWYECPPDDLFDCEDCPSMYE